jgi:hypothetical protein|tara:strand:+ start:13941 stop:14183 length:243 start_codon:yes stop_codon:yes gene_type:complete
MQRKKIINVLKSNAISNMQLHVSNVELYLTNSVGIGEHSDIMEAINVELDKVAKYQGRWDALELVQRGDVYEYDDTKTEH